MQYRSTILSLHLEIGVELFLDFSKDSAGCGDEVREEDLFIGCVGYLLGRKEAGNGKTGVGDCGAGERCAGCVVKYAGVGGD